MRTREERGDEGKKGRGNLGRKRELEKGEKMTERAMGLGTKEVGT